MNKYIALLRGINVSGQKKIIMKDLVLLFEEIGFLNVKTYIQSGNIIFDFTNIVEKELENLIINKIKKVYGFEVGCIVLQPKFLIKTLQNNPFQYEKNVIVEKMYFTFLNENPSLENINQLMSKDYSPDIFLIKNRVLYFYSPIGVGKSKLTNKIIEKKLNVIATARNWNTIKKIIELSKV